ncbi:MAG: translation initiation factor IF-3 [Chitinivibrionales bacterium]|nr:translation initiation factor IF-3 [Chitinivibrionales bacterium]
MNRRNFRRPVEDPTRVNERIRVPQVRVVGSDGSQLGIMPTYEAQEQARKLELDLVEVAPTANPPVCRIMDYGKFKYEKAKKAKEAKKKQHVVHLKEIKLHPKTDTHDYNYKMEHGRKFLFRGDRLKATVVFRGREITHKEFGARLLDQLDIDLADIAQVEQSCKMEGRNMVSIYVPDKAKIKDLKRKEEQERKRREKEATLEQQQAESQ